MLDKLDASLEEFDQPVADQARAECSGGITDDASGVGLVTSLVSLLTIGPVEGFERSKQVAS